MSFPSTACAACKLRHWKCTQSCVLAPYFPPNEPYKVKCVSQVFGLSKIKKMLNDISPEQREAAVKTLVYEAQARIQNPVYGCVSHIYLLQLKVDELRLHLYNVQKELATYIGPAASDPFRFSAPAPAPSQFHHPQFQGSAPFAEQEMTELSPTTGAATPQPMIWDQSQSQSQMLVEARQMVEVGASAAAQEQQMFSSYDQQQQQELLRLSNVEQLGGGVTESAGGPPAVISQSKSPFFDSQQGNEKSFSRV